MIWVIVVLAVLIAAIALVLFMPKKKVNEQPGAKPANLSRPYEETVRSGAGYAAGAGATVSQRKNYEQTVSDARRDPTVSVPGLERTGITITLVDNEDKRDISTFIEGSFTIGRNDASSLPIRDQQVSWNHAVLTSAGGKLFIKDAGSTNGTFVNDKRVIEAVPLKGGEVIKLGPNTWIIVKDN